MEKEQARSRWASGEVSRPPRPAGSAAGDDGSTGSSQFYPSCIQFNLGHAPGLLLCLLFAVALLDLRQDASLDNGVLPGSIAGDKEAVVTQLDVSHGVLIADFEPAALGFANRRDAPLGPDGFLRVALGGLEKGSKGDKLNVLGNTLTVDLLFCSGSCLGGRDRPSGGSLGGVRGWASGFAADEGSGSEEEETKRAHGGHFRVYRRKRGSSKGAGGTSVAPP